MKMYVRFLGSCCMKSLTSLLIGLVAVGTIVVAVGSIAGCDEQGSAKPSAPGERAEKPPKEKEKPALEKVTIGGRTFQLEPVFDDEHRFKGLSGRTEIAPDGGMLFVFKEPKVQEFVMRDCPIPIDIIYLDAAGRITAMHKMVPEPPRAEDEKALTLPSRTAPEWSGTNEKYEKRLKKYSSRFASQFVIELKGNTLDELSLKEGDKVELDRARLKKLAK
jgi:uncharacterized protein